MSIIRVPINLFDKMCKGVQCMEISDGYVNQSFFFKNKEVVITGTMSSGVKGYIRIWGHYIVDIENYKEDLKPLNRSEHWIQVSDGKRERGYRGQKSKYGNRTIVFIGEKLTFDPLHDEVQLELF
jgi:hypothetical protein